MNCTGNRPDARRRQQPQADYKGEGQKVHEDLLHTGCSASDGMGGAGMKARGPWVGSRSLGPARPDSGAQVAFLKIRLYVNRCARKMGIVQALRAGRFLYAADPHLGDRR